MTADPTTLRALIARLEAGETGPRMVMDLHLWLNKPEFDFRLLELVMTLERMQSTTGYYTGSLDVRASIDFGRNWSSWVTIPLDGHEPYQEKKAYFNMVGKQVRFEVRFSTPLVIEGMRIGFNAQYKSMKFDS